MRTKVTLVLLFLNVALLAVIIHTRRQWHAEQDLARMSKRVLGDEAVNLKSLEITSTGSDRKIRFERSGENAPWDLKEPINWPANDFAIRRIIHELQFLEPQTSFPVAEVEKKGQSLADYGLNPPRLTLTFTRPATEPDAPDITTRLQIGDTPKISNVLYVLSPDEKTVHVVDRKLADSLIVGMEELRTDTLFSIPVFEVRSLGIQNTAPAPRVRLRRGDGSRWIFEAPIATRADKAAAEVVIGGLNRLRALDFIADAIPADTGLDQPSLRVTLEGNSRRETLLVGNPYPVDASFKKDPEAPATPYYARMERMERMEERPQVFVTSIPDKLLDTLHRAKETLRDTRVLDFAPAAVTSISLAAPGQPEPLVLRREDPAPGATASTTWRIVRPAGAPALPADAKLIDNLLQRLALLTATAPTPFLRDAPTDADIENYGFNLPQREITLTLSPSSRITLQLGVSGANGGTVQARVLGQPFIYSVAPDTLNDYPVAANVYRERTLRALPEGTHITGLTLVANDAPDKPIVSLKLAPNQSWEDMLAGETEPRREALKTLLAGLRTLRAQKFVGDTFTETTLVDGKPTPWKYKLEATLGNGGAEGGNITLQIAERSGGGTQLAGSKELGVVFAVEQTLLDALWALTYGERDPGPPAAPATTPAPLEPAPVAAP
jgi:hypothetical protein